MTAIAFVLLGFIVVTAATFTADWCKAQWPAVFGLAPAKVTATDRGLGR